MAQNGGWHYAMGELYRRNVGYVERMFSKRNHRDFALEIEAAAWEKVLTKIGTFRFDAGATFKTWLGQIAINEFLRIKKRDKRITFIDSYDIEESTDFAIDGDQERDYENRRMGEDIMVELEALPQKYREAITLRDVENKPYGEISLLQGVPVGTVKSRINRGREILRKKLRKYAHSNT